MRRARGDDGAAAVEFALVLPLLLLLLCGIIDFGRAFNARITLTHAAREGVRVYALGGTLAEATTRVNAAAVGLTGITVTATGCTFGGPTTLTATSSFTYITPFIAKLAPATTTLKADGVMRCGG